MRSKFAPKNTIAIMLIYLIGLIPAMAFLNEYKVFQVFEG